MSALFTQTLEEKIQVLLVAQDTAFSHQLREKIEDSQPQLQVKLRSWRQFLAVKNGVQPGRWYRLVFLFEEPQLQSFSQNELNNFFSNLDSDLLPKINVIFPLTSQVRDTNEIKQKELSSWLKQAGQELILFKLLKKHFSANQFIFYQHLAKTDSYPLKYFLERIEKNLLLDPKGNIDLLNQDLLVSKLTQLSLRPQTSPILIKGSTHDSSSLLDLTKETLNQYGQLTKLKSQPLSLLPTEILAELTVTIKEKVLSVDQQELANWIAKQIVGFFGKQAEKDESDERKTDQQSSTPEMKPPQKDNLIKNWNRLKKSLTDLAKNDSDQDSTQTTETELNGKKLDKSNKIAKDPEIEATSLFSELREKQNDSHLQKLSEETQRGLKKIKHNRLLFWLGGLMTLISLGVLAVTVFYFINLKRIKNVVIEGLAQQSPLETTTVQQDLGGQNFDNEEVERLSGLLVWTRDKTGPVGDLLRTTLFPKSGQILDLTSALVNAKQAQLRLSQSSNKLYQQLMVSAEAENNIPLSKLISQLERDADQTHRAISLLISEFKNLELSSFTAQQTSTIESYQEKLQDQEKALTQLRQLSPLLLSLLGSNQPRVYAVILQNEQELRPTGGFIEAVGLLTFADGQLTDLQVEDVYQLDQQLKGIMRPPADLVRFLGEERWYLRDANWQPDFAETGERIAWFVDQSLGVKVDGVIALNLKVLEQLLTVLGPINLSSYNEVVTAKNINERMEYHSEVQLENSQLENYPQLILRETLTAFQNLEPSQIQPVLSQIREAFEAKELMATVINPEEEGIFASLGWGGRMFQPVCPTIFGDTPCITDSLSQVEANVGINKANYYLDRQIDHTIELRADQISHRRLITYKNQAPSNNWPKGPYRAYTRFYLPSEAQLGEVKINQQVVGFNDLVTASLEDQLLIGVYTNTPVGDKTELEISYSLPYEKQTPFTYVFFDRKQAGARESSPRVFLNHSPDLQPTLIAPQAEVQADLIVFSPSKATGHTFVGATFE